MLKDTYYGSLFPPDLIYIKR